MVSTDHKVQLIGDGDGNLTGVDGDGDGDENEAPINIENESHLDYQDDQEEFHTNQEDQTIQQPVKIELDTLEEGHTSIEQVPEVIAPHTVQEYMQPERPNEIPGVCKSSRVKFQMKQEYIPSITVSKYAVYVYQLEDHGSLHTDSNILSMNIQEEQPDVITAIMAQLPLKVRFQ